MSNVNTVFSFKIYDNDLILEFPSDLIKYAIYISVWLQ